MSTKVTGLYDAGKGMIQQLEYRLTDTVQKMDVARWVSTQFIIGAGGFSNGDPKFKRPKDELAEKWKVPRQRSPDKVYEHQTTTNQAIIYRLSGDTNPLHISPEYAKRQFPAPILHGLCTFGIAARAILWSFCHGDAKKFKMITCRFSSPVYPGDKLTTEMWDMGVVEVNGKQRRVVTFETKVVEKKLTVINSGIAYVAV